MITALKKYKTWTPFTNEEAWVLFRLAAFSEAAGWTLLIAGILCKRFIVHGNDTPVLLAGHTHGILFLIYIVAVLVLAPSLGWSWWRTVTAGLCSVPPYGSLAFEMWANHHRQKTHLSNLNSLICYNALIVRL